MLLATFSYLLLLMTMIIGWITFPNRKGVLRLLPVYITIVFGLEMLAYWLMKHKKHNMEVYDIMSILEFSLYSLLYYYVTVQRYTRILIGIFALLFALSLVLFYGHIYRYTFYNIISTFLSMFFMVIMAVNYLAEVLRSDNIISFNDNPMIWISIGLLLYLSCSAFLVTSNYFKIVYAHHSLVHNVVTFISVLCLYTCMTTALLCKRR